MKDILQIVTSLANSNSGKFYYLFVLISTPICFSFAKEFSGLDRVLIVITGCSPVWVGILFGVCKIFRKNHRITKNAHQN